MKLVMGKAISFRTMIIGQMHVTNKKINNYIQMKKITKVLPFFFLAVMALSCVPAKKLHQA